MRVMTSNCTRVPQTVYNTVGSIEFDMLICHFIYLYDWFILHTKFSLNSTSLLNCTKIPSYCRVFSPTVFVSLIIIHTHSALALVNDVDNDSKFTFFGRIRKNV